MFYTDPHCTCAFSHRVVRGIYTYRRGASALLVQTGLGNAKASMRGTSDRTGSTFSCIYTNIENQFIMRKVMFKWLVMFLAVVLCAGVVSCKDDDDDDNGASGNSIVGTWRYDFGYNAYALMTFNEDLTGIYREYDEEDGGWWSYTFTWLQNNGKVMVIDDEDGYGDEYYNVTVTATKLTWTYNNGYGSEKQVWTRQQ